MYKKCITFGVRGAEEEIFFFILKCPGVCFLNSAHYVLFARRSRGLGLKPDRQAVVTPSLRGEVGSSLSAVTLLVLLSVASLKPNVLQIGEVALC